MICALCRRVPPDLLAFLLLSSTLAALSYNGLTRGTFGWFDEARHTMDGVFFADFLYDLPLSHVYQYAVEYFIRFPALSLSWNPPGFGVLAGVLLLIGGLNPILVRLLILCLTVVGLLAWYFWALRIWGRQTAVLSALIVITNEIVHFWTTAIMLEMPVVALMNCTLFCLSRYLERQNVGRGLVLSLLVAAMLLTKQSSLFILPAFFLYPVLANRTDVLWSRASLPVYLLGLSALAILVAHAWALGSVGIAERLGNLSVAAGAPPRFSIERWVLYARVLRDSFGWPIIMLALIGCVEVVRRRGPADVIILAWIALWYVAFGITCGDYQDALRYSTYVAFPVALLAARSQLLTSAPTWLRRTAQLILFGAITWNGWQSYTTQLPAMSSFRELAQFVQNKAGNRPVLYCCRFDGEFIFERRRLDPRRQGVTLRADKILVNFSIMPAYGMVSFVDNRADILALLYRYGVEILVIESDDNLHVPQFSLLRETVEGPEFDLLGEFLVTESYASAPPNLMLRVYRYRNVRSVQNGIISVPAPQFGTWLELQVAP
jgi:hypothetical protein